MAIFSVFYWSFFVASLPVFFLPQLLLWVLTAPFDRRRLALHLYACFWGHAYVWLNPFWRSTFVGKERLPWNGPAVIVANHLSILDILVLYGLFRPFKWVSKASIFRIPFIGWNMTLNDYVPLRRGDRASIQRMMDHCRRHLAAGMPVLLFPEGTRSLDGVLQPFKEGAFRLACEAGCPLIPVAISGTERGLPKHGVMLRNRMHARVEVLAPILPADHGGDPARLREVARAAIAAALPAAGLEERPPAGGAS
jgi:1-acyl-sn-glycerol-3-phosphate acyltransferase